MKTDKFNTTTETFNENVSNSMKWFHDYSALILEAQTKQFKFATELFNNAFTSSFANFGKPNFATSFGGSEKITEMIQKNMETISKMSAENMKTIMELSTQANAALFSKEAMQQFTDAYTKQVE